MPLVLLFILAQAPVPPARPLRVPLVLAAAGQGADVSVTCYALHTGRYRESNPMLPSRCPTIAATKAATVIASSLITRAIGRRHPVAARRLAWVMVATSWIPVAINAHRLR